jgi:hypothetical protein
MTALRLAALALLLAACGGPPPGDPPPDCRATLPQEKDGGIGGTGHDEDPCAD